MTLSQADGTQPSSERKVTVSSHPPFNRGIAVTAGCGLLDELLACASRACVEDTVGGRRGAVYFAETNYAGDPLDQLVAQGATATAMPEPLRKCIAAGIKPPRHFGEVQLAALFPPAYWETLKSGPMTMHGGPLTTKDDFEPIPSFYAIVRPSAPGSVRT